MRAQSAAAAWQAARDYDTSRGVPFEAFVRERVMEAALLRYRQEWRYVTRYGADTGGPKRNEPRIEVVASDLFALREAVNLLPPAEKRLIRDLFWQERTEASVARRSGVSQQAVSKQKKAALRHLRQALTPPSSLDQKRLRHARAELPLARPAPSQSSESDQAQVSCSM
jgi:DNA-directed RNA polymerase specialized sigma subunit